MLRASLVFVLVSGCAASVPPSPAESSSAPSSPWSARHLALHVDPIDSTKPRDAEEFAASIRKHDGWARLLHLQQPAKKPWQAEDGVWWTMRPFDAWSDLAAHQAAQVDVDHAVQKQVGTNVYEANEERAHTTLLPGHRNEIWTRDDDDSYVPAATATPLDLARAPFARATFLTLRPSRENDLDRALRAAKTRLGAANDPHALLVFSSSYGSGDVILFRLAESRAVAEAFTDPAELPPDAKVLKTVVFAAQADLMSP